MQNESLSLVDRSIYCHEIMILTFPSYFFKLAICNEKKSSHDFDKSTENVNQIYHEKVTHYFLGFFSLCQLRLDNSTPELEMQVNAAAYPSKSVKDKNDR